MRDLAAQRGQVIAVAITAFLGVALFGGSYDAFQDLNASYALMFQRTSFADVVAVGGDAQSIATETRSLAGVERVTVREVADVPLLIGGRKLLGRVIGAAPGNEPAVDSLVVVSGRGLATARPGEVVAEQHLASTFGLNEGSTVDVLGTTGWRTFRVAGTAASAEYLWPARDRQNILTPPDEFGVVFASAADVALLPAEARHVETLVRFSPAASRDALTTSVRAAALRHGAVDTFTQAEQPSNAALREDINGFGELSLLFPLLFLGAGGLATYVLLSRLVRRQRAQIGLLLANGFAPHEVFAHYLAYGLTATLVGGIPGVIVGTLLGATIAGEYAHELSIPVRVIELHPLTILVGLTFAAVAGTLSALGPALAAARMPPAEAMRPLSSLTHGGDSFIERVLPPARRWPIRWLLVLRGIGRNPRRSASTTVGVALGITLVLVSWGMLDTTEYALDRQFVRIQREDAQVAFAAPVTADQVASLASTSGVAAAEPVAESTVVVRSAGGSYSTRLIALPPATTMRGFLRAGGGETPLPPDGVLLGASMRDRLHLGVGDPVELVIGSAAGSGARSTVAGFVDEPLGTYAYVALPYLGSVLGAPAASVAHGVLLRFSTGADPSAMRERLSAIPEVVAYVDSKALARTARQYMGLFYVFVGIMLALGGVMAFALIFIAMSVNVAERSSEMAILRANGMERGTIARLLTAEGMLLTALGIVPGLLVGYAAAWGFMRSFSSDLFNFDLHVRATTLALTALAALAVALLSLRPALRMVADVDVARVVREISA